VILFGLLPLLLVGLGLSFLLDDGPEDNPPPESDDLTLTPGDDVLDMGNTTASEVNALAGNDTITSQESRPLVLRLGAGADVAELSNGFAEVYDGSGVEILVNGNLYVKLEGITTLDGWIVNVRENFIWSRLPRPRPRRDCHPLRRSRADGCILRRHAGA
jgi:hypothetical protein